MRNISFFQIIILVFLSVLIFTDLPKVKKKITGLVKRIRDKNRKKGS